MPRSELVCVAAARGFFFADALEDAIVTAALPVARAGPTEGFLEVMSYLSSGVDSYIGQDFYPLNGYDIEHEVISLESSS
jgi:hypothetical protein